MQKLTRRGGWNLKQLLSIWNSRRGKKTVDQHVSNYPVPIKWGKKYYRIFFHLLELVLWNSYILLQNRGQDNFSRTETVRNTDCLEISTTNNFTKRRMSRKISKFASPIRKALSWINSSKIGEGKHKKPVCNDACFTTPHNNSKQLVPEAIFLFCCQYYSVTTWELGVLFLFYHMHTYED